MKYLITGKNGQLAQEFVRRFEKDRLDYLALDRNALDITVAEQVNHLLDSYRPDVIINCAAYNLVDRAEEDREKASLVNSLGPKMLAQAAHKRSAFLVHFSTDYVFDGTKEDGLYVEEDKPNPLNHYGMTKLAGEINIRNETDRYLIFRVSWLYGRGKQNFIYKLLEWSKSNEYVKVAYDEFSIPTSAETVVDVAVKAIEQRLTGLFHLTNSGFCSRYEWAKLILATLGIDKFIRPVSMDTFALPAKRPKFSAMQNKKLSGRLNTDIVRWNEAVSSFVGER
ncbi:MAG: dTDP-4-dehydrorhamnose reductase, partial [bacterium]